MVSKPKKKTKKLVAGICITTLAAIVVVVAIIFATKSTAQINDSYFVSNDKQYVLNVTSDMMEFENTEYAPVITHIVYKYSGDKITDITSYLEFNDESTASSLLPKYKEIYDASDYSGIKSISANGKYIVVVTAEDQYSDMSASQIKQEIDSIESLKNTPSTDSNSGTNE